MASPTQCPALSQISHPQQGAAWSVDAAAERDGWSIWAGPFSGWLIDSPVIALPNNTDIFVDVDDFDQQPQMQYGSGTVVCNYPVGEDASGESHRLILKNASHLKIDPKLLSHDPFQKVPFDTASYECHTDGMGSGVCRWL